MAIMYFHPDMTFHIDHLYKLSLNRIQNLNFLLNVYFKEQKVGQIQIHDFCVGSGSAKLHGLDRSLIRNPGSLTSPNPHVSLL